MVFYMAAAPTGWSRVALSNTWMIRVVADSSSGGGSGGTDDPVFNDKVPSHNHTYSGSTDSKGHSHTITGGSHVHAFRYKLKKFDNTGSIDVMAPDGDSSGKNTDSASHSHSVSTSTQSYTYSGTTDNNSSSSNWSARRLDFILCEKD